MSADVVKRDPPLGDQPPHKPLRGIQVFGGL
jgi:hypothetical protein